MSIPIGNQCDNINVSHRAMSGQPRVVRLLIDNEFSGVPALDLSDLGTIATIIKLNLSKKILDGS